MDLPQDVIKNLEFLRNKEVWHIHSTNPKVISCPQAASNRRRLGHIGIPIFDELKSELGYFINSNKEEQNVLVHCRGNQRLDRLKISSILNAEYQRRKNKKESKGLINPFGQDFKGLLQIFDVSTTIRLYPPYTMMTNAGDFEHAVEFEPSHLINALENVVVADVVRNNNYSQFKRHKIGILTGNGPESGILLWTKINETVKTELQSRLNHSFRGDLSFPEIIIESVPEMGISMELDIRAEATENIVIESIINLCQRGATIICIACNTTQYFKERIEKICSLHNATFVSLYEVIDEYLKSNDITEFDLLGVSHVADFSGYSAFKRLNSDYKISIPKSKAESGRSKIDEIAYLFKKGHVNNAANLFNNLAQSDLKYDCAIIALTEISALRERRKKDIGKLPNLKDSLDFLASRVAQLYIDGIYDTLYVDKESSNMSFELLNSDSLAKEESRLWNILCEIDYEFVPPLSYRDSTTFSFSNSAIESEQPKPESYFKNLLNQEILVSRFKSTNQINGFMSYIPDHLVSHEKTQFQCHYITTIGVTKGARGHGIAKRFYAKIEEIVKKLKSERKVATRTWSTNITHIRILEELGYKKIIQIVDDRGPGIHTVYYLKSLDAR